MRSGCFALINCGFYEGHQASLALEMMKNWCVNTGILWGQGIGIGGGGMLASRKDLLNDQGLLRNLGDALGSLVQNVTRAVPAEDLFTVPNFPKVFYALGGNMGWRKQIKASGLTTGDIHTKK